VHTSVVLTTVLTVTLCGRTVAMLTLAVLALRGTTPNQRPRILMALAAGLAAIATPSQVSDFARPRLGRRCRSRTLLDAT
jgi:hypothetical protein